MLLLDIISITMFSICIWFISTQVVLPMFSRDYDYFWLFKDCKKVKTRKKKETHKNEQ